MIPSKLGRCSVVPAFTRKHCYWNGECRCILGQGLPNISERDVDVIWQWALDECVLWGKLCNTGFFNFGIFHLWPSIAERDYRDKLLCLLRWAVLSITNFYFRLGQSFLSARHIWPWNYSSTTSIWTQSLLNKRAWNKISSHWPSIKFMCEYPTWTKLKFCWKCYGK
jgi:hypothetical protein